MYRSTLAEPYGSSRLVTTVDAARALERSTWTVRWMARTGQLVPYETLPSGQRLFREGDVQRAMKQRADARMRRVTALRPRKANVSGEPRQMSLFSAHLRLVGGRVQPSTGAEVHRARSAGNRPTSDNGRSVNQRSHR